ncbi:hypothetical protein IKQ26_03045 [bacterium]|nr:hypothetical protein [bacterium]
MSKKCVQNKLISCILAVFAVFLLASQNAFASSTLFEIEIKNNPEENNITLYMDEIADVKKKVLSDDRIILTLSDTKQTENVPVVFEGDVDNLLVREDKNNVEITLQGENSAKSNVFVKELNSGNLKQVYSGNDKRAILQNGFYVLDGKFTSIIVLGLIFMFTMFAFVKPRREEQVNKLSTFKKSETKADSNMQTIRNQKRAKNAPYIHFGYNTIPNDLVVNQTEEQKQIRKYG